MEATRLHALMLLAGDPSENRGDFGGVQLRALFSLFCSHDYLIGYSLKNFSAQRLLQALFEDVRLISESLLWSE